MNESPYSPDAGSPGGRVDRGQLDAESHDTALASTGSPTPDYRDRAWGMIVGGALGDALGADIEFESIDSVRDRYGAHGITELPGTRLHPAVITDDTQMSLFTLEGLIIAHSGARRDQQVSSIQKPEDRDTLNQTQHGTADTAPSIAGTVRTVHSALLRWLDTQHWSTPSPGPRASSINGWLIRQPALHVPRSPGSTCLSALRATSAPNSQIGSISNPLNNSKGCGAVMRAASVALWSADPAIVFQVAIEIGALTHSHPTGYLAAGACAVMARALLTGHTLLSAVDIAVTALRDRPGHEETTDALNTAVGLANRTAVLTPEGIATQLGGGWVGEEALAIAVYAALRATTFTDGIRLAVNHSGDSDSTGAIAGNLLGAHFGHAALPQSWLEQLELVDVMDELVVEALDEFSTDLAG